MEENSFLSCQTLLFGFVLIDGIGRNGMRWSGMIFYCLVNHLKFDGTEWNDIDSIII